MTNQSNKVTLPGESAESAIDMPVSGYEDRVAAQIEQYADVPNIHELPDSFHHWSHNFIGPGVRDVFGVETVVDFYVSGFQRAAAGSAMKTRKILSLGCGDGWLEVDLARRLLERDVRDFEIVGADISPPMLARFADKVREHDLSGFVTPLNLDLNAATLAGPWTAIMAHHSLHHFVELEAIFDYCFRTLEPQGLLITNDMIGKNGHMRWPETALVLKLLWRLLKEEQRFNAQLRTMHKEFTDHDCSESGFEGIRAQDILPLLLERFHPVNFAAMGGFIDVLVDRGYGHGFDMTKPEDRNFIQSVAELNEIMLDAGMIKPTIMFGYFSKQVQPERCYRQRSARRSVRDHAPDWLAYY